MPTFALRRARPENRDLSAVRCIHAQILRGCGITDGEDEERSFVDGVRLRAPLRKRTLVAQVGKRRMPFGAPRVNQ